ncbi:MAG: transcription-repair coupling factor [Planctomycetaceae bacterium]|jgi:transcription-repair coupling factor (superfamily II helicase)|nr:transcription-repair coupling factor [Planctomycetaceae bacterium]
MALQHLTDLLRADISFLACIDALRRRKAVVIDRIWGSSCAMAAAALAMEKPVQTIEKPPQTSRISKKPSLLTIAVDNQENLERFCDDLSLFFGQNVVAFPEIDDMETPFRIADERFGKRIRVLKTLAEQSADQPAILVASIAALLQPVPTANILQKKTRQIQVGKELAQNELTRWLVDGGYHATSGVELPGEFALRGSIVDIFAPDWETPVRIEFFGDEIESLRKFEVATQRSLEKIREISLTQLRQDEIYEGFLSDYLSSESWLMLVEPEQLETSGRDYLRRFSQPEKLHKISDVFQRLLAFPAVSANTLAQKVGDVVYSMNVASVYQLHGGLPKIREELMQIDVKDFYLVCQTDAEITRLTEAFELLPIARQNRLHFLTGRLSCGFRLLEHSIIVIGANQLFERNDLRQTSRRRLVKAIDSFTELKEGDYVVHVSHGIARYHGFLLLTKGTQEEEHLKLEFADEVVLYVPVSKIGFVQKYIAGGKSKPKLAKLHGQLWAKQKREVQEAVFDLAVEMIDIQAAREFQPGISFPEDSDWQREFDAAFPYHETADQRTAIETVKNDMQKRRPMDRLICGDVGFGKTEVAIRAVFKAVDAGYQTAVLVPTTVLAEQHYRTFSERLREFPFEIAALSRFASKKRQEEIIEQLAEGTIDIVIGTHRLVQQDVKFKNLGLVVIDEEQRFGVTTKEQFKHIRTTVDVLTMTATPIPRTLHLSLLGIRDISNLETPPDDRRAVETKLARWDEQLIRSAFLREIQRGGQIFFVHNRVNDIELIASKLRRLTPEARVSVGHAQMPEHELEQTMLDFIQHKFDVLVATTIIESGLDIPNANTIFIDEADRYGLSDLHQLRGRVGRYRNQAYCYLIVHPDKILSDLSRKRLRAIEEYSRLGAGFSIAMRDLEIRGAGNILGTRQSGHIAAVGYEMYCDFLDAAVRTLKQLPQKNGIDVEIDLPGKALIPMNYVSDQRQKIDLYRRIVRISTREELADFRREIEDRFGKLPKSAERLLLHAEIRVDANYWRIKSIRRESDLTGDYIVFHYLMRDKIEKLQSLCKQTIRIADDKSAYLPLSHKNRTADGLLLFVKMILRNR